MNTQWRLVQLQFGRSPAHFGEVGIGLESSSERIRSDTLFSAWITAYAQLFGGEAVADLLGQFQLPNQPPFRLSSTFIYQWIQGEICYYLPRPHQLPPHYPVGQDFEFAKDYKKLHYLPLEVWRRWYQTDGFSKADLSLAESYGKAYQMSQLPKVAVDRTTRGTNFFHTSFVNFRWQPEGNGNGQAHRSAIKSLSGLYFLLKFEEDPSVWEQNLQAALHFLGEEGIGGERSSGAGRFQFLWQALPERWFPIIEFQNHDHHSLISLFWDEGLDSSFSVGASYELLERGGWVTSPFSGRQLRRKSVRMFTEGSVFKTVPQGQLANVTPDEFKQNGQYKPHPIYRNGIALSLPINVFRPGDH